jgi:23S rRNA pseudouridine2457 synthase
MVRRQRLAPAAEAPPKAPSGASKLVLFNKPYGVVCQFTSHTTRPTLKDYIDIPGVYAAGRLDWDSEGLLVLTDDGPLQHRISDPAGKQRKIYWAQVEGNPQEEALAKLRGGINLGDFVTRPAQVHVIDEPAGLWRREPPIRVRKAIPTAWLEVTLIEGKNRQIRRMTAAVGHPTLRLIRHRVGPWTVDSLAPGAHRFLTPILQATTGP